MKSLFALILIVISSEALADVGVEVAPQLVDSSIKRQLKDGSVQSFDGNEYQIVKRKKKKPVVVAAPAPVPEKTFTKEETSQLIVEHAKMKPNSLFLLAGNGPRGLEHSGNAVSLERGLIFGAAYAPLITEDVRLMFQVLSNRSVLVGAGKDF